MLHFVLYTLVKSKSDVKIIPLQQDLYASMEGILEVI